MKKSPRPGIASVGALRDAVRRKSVGLSFTTNIFARKPSTSNGDDDESRQAAANATATGERTSHPSSSASPSGGFDDDAAKRFRVRSDSYQGSDGEGSSPSTTSDPTTYVEPPEPPSLPPGGLLEAATKNVQGKMKDLMETYHEVTQSLDDPDLQCSVFLSRSALFSDRLVVFLGDSDGSPAGVWSARLCVRSGHGGGGIFKGSLGSMLPYIIRAKEDKLGIVLFDDVFRDCVHGPKIDFDMAVKRFMTGWRNHVLTSRATHVFVVAYRDGSLLLLEALRQHTLEMQRLLSGVAFIQPTYSVSSADAYVLRKLIAQWCVAYVSSHDPLLNRLKGRETDLGCICVSAGTDNDDTEVLANIVVSVYAGFKARWSGFRVRNVNSGMEKSCYLCKNIFNMRRWRRHCRTCQNPCCDKCSSMETTRHEGQVRLCNTCRVLSSLIQWSRPRAVRTGEKESVFSGSAKPGKMAVSDFELVTVIGRGACGKVLLVIKKEGADAGSLYAMKVLKKDWVLDKDLVQQTMAERRILQEANHPYIVQLRYAFQNLDKLYMVMDYYSGGSLRQVLRRRGRFSIKRARFYLAQILLAISHLHGLNILYRDLKLENIVISADGNVACTDFGLSKEEMNDSERTSSFVGTCEYLAPELILKEGYGKPVDWWAFGILAYEMIQGDSPFRHNVPSLLFEKILKEEPVFSERFTPEAKDLITNLLTKDPTYRLGCGEEGVDEIKNHPFFADIDWTGLLNMSVDVPRPPHRMEDVTDESHINRAIAKIREAREEMMPDSPVSLPSSPSEQKHFDRFTFHGNADQQWDPSMADMQFDEETGEFVAATIPEDEEYTGIEEGDEDEEEDEDEDEEEEEEDHEEQDQRQEEEGVEAAADGEAGDRRAPTPLPHMIEDESASSSDESEPMMESPLSVHDSIPGTPKAPASAPPPAPATAPPAIAIPQVAPSTPPAPSSPQAPSSPVGPLSLGTPREPSLGTPVQPVSPGTPRMSEEPSTGEDAQVPATAGSPAEVCL